MRLLGTEWNKREATLLFLVLILTLFSLSITYVSQEQIKHETKFYSEKYYECIESINQYNQGYTNVWNEPQNVINYSQLEIK